MPFTETGKDTKGRRILKETVTLGNTTTVYSGSFQVEKGEDFVVIGNTGAVNTVGAVTVEVQVSADNSTFATITSSFMASIDSTTLASFYDNSLKGDAPYFRLAIASAANDSANSAEFVVIV